MKKQTIFLTCLLASEVCGFSQQFLSCSISGQIVANDKSNLNTLRVQVYDLTQRTRVATVPVMIDGTFSGPGISIGQYKFDVVTAQERSIYEDLVTVTPNCGAVTLRLPEDSARPASGGISLSRLTHHVPSAALKEFRRAQHDAQNGDNAASLEHLQKAVRIDPDFFEAHLNLGAAFMQRNDLHRASSEFSEATILDSSSPMAWIDLAIAHIHLGKPEAARDAANHALRLDPTSIPANYALAVSWAMLRQFDQPILEHLEGTYSKYPHARILSAQVLAGQGKYSEAREQVQMYLESRRVTDRAKAEEYLRQLTTVAKKN